MISPAQPVRLTPSEQTAQPEIGDTIGRVIDVENGAARVDFAGRWCWIAVGKLEGA